MYNLFMLISNEIFFSIQNKKNYFFQTIMNYIERIIFLSGMILLLGEKNNITIQSILRCGFWFILVNGFLEISQRIESEIRLKQFDKCFNCKSSFWIILVCRIVPIFIDSFFIVALSSLLVSLIVKINFSVSLVNFFFYVFMMVIQYIFLMYIFAFIGIYFKRIQAIMGLVESYTFFYSGIVIVSSCYSLTIFKTINKILDAGFNFNIIPLFIVCLETIIVFLGTKIITYYLKTK